VISRNVVLTGLMVSLLLPILSTRVVAQSPKLHISSSAFADGTTIPTQFTCSGANQSPQLSWSGTPQGTKSLALLVEDPDAPSGTFVHWVVYDIPPSSQGFKEGKVGGTQGANGMGKASYMGPCPPPGKPHHYHFRLFALDSNPNVEANPTAQALRNAVTGHILESAELVGIFER
jgi:Raf kinase inhibitor-like YbhB/YbcL family protein